jgi:sirohydrochlorin cobaltochelatase
MEKLDVFLTRSYCLCSVLDLFLPSGPTEQDHEMISSRIVLFAHGSTDPVWQETFRGLVRELRAGLGQQSVALAFMDRSEPSLREVAVQAAADRVQRMLVLPMFFSAGGHVSRDIPRLVDDARSLAPELEIELLRPIGEHPSFADLVARVARAALGDAEGSNPWPRPAVDRELRKQR